MKRVRIDRSRTRFIVELVTLVQAKFNLMQQKPSLYLLKPTFNHQEG